jgi:hypothetical protein
MVDAWFGIGVGAWFGTSVGAWLLKLVWYILCYMVDGIG